MDAKKIVLSVLILVCLLATGCMAEDKPAEESNIQTEMSAPEISPKGGLPTPFKEMSLGDYGNNPYDRKLEAVDYDAIESQEYKIRSAIEFVGINSYRIVQTGQEPDDFLEVDVSKYGINKYCSYGDLVMFRTYDDMISVMHNKDFQRDLKDIYGFNYEPTVYYLPAFFGEDYSERSFVPLDGKYHLIIYGYEYSNDRNYYSDVWAVFDVKDSPGAEKIAEFYAKLDDLELRSDEGPTDTVYHFTSKNGCAFFEKFGVETNDPATAYIWEQEGVLGVIILAGDYNPEYIDLCVLEKHDL